MSRSLASTTADCACTYVGSQCQYPSPPHFQKTEELLMDNVLSA